VVVTQESACYGARRNFHQVELEANHVELNKFGSLREDNYQRLVKLLIEFHGRAGHIVEGRLGSTYTPT